MRSKTFTKATLLTMGSAALIVAGGAWASGPAPVTVLSAHSPANLDFSIDAAGAQNSLNFDPATGELTSLACSQGSGNTCSVMDGSGDGMIQYMITNTNTGQSFIELLVGSKDTTNGLFLSDTLVMYNGNPNNGGGGVGTNVSLSADSMASKYIIEDPNAMTNPTAAGGFTLDAQWLRGFFQTTTSGFTEAEANSAGGANGTRNDAVIDQTIYGMQTFHYDGEVGETADVLVASISIGQGTNAANTNSNPLDAAAMGSFEYYFQSGIMNTNNPGQNTNTYPASASINYDIGSSGVITLGTATLAYGATNGISAVYIGQQMYGSDGTDSYNTQTAGQRQFGYINYTLYSGATGSGPIAIGTFTDPEIGQAANVGSITMTSQVGANGSLTAYGSTAQNTAEPAGYVNDVTTSNTSDTTFGAGAGNAGSFSNASALLTQWSSIFSADAVVPGAGVGSNGAGDFTGQSGPPPAPPTN